MSKIHLRGMKKLVNFLTMALFLGFVFYLVLFVVMGFPHPQWFKDSVKDLKGTEFKIEPLKD